MPTTHSEFNLVNAVWSLSLFAVVIGVIWYKMGRLRVEVHALVEALPKLGSVFIQEQIADVKEDLNTTRARVTICEEKLGLNGQPGPGWPGG